MLKTVTQLTLTCASYLGNFSNQSAGSDSPVIDSLVRNGVWIVLLSMWFSVLAPAFAFDSQTKKPVFAKTVRENLSGRSLALYSGKFQSSNALARSVLQSRLARPMSNDTSLHESSNVILRDGSRMIKYAREFHGLPITNDWAMLLLSKQNYVLSAQYELSQADAKVSNLDQYWPLSFVEILRRLSSDKEFNIQPDTLKKTWFSDDEELLPAFSVSANKVVSGVPALFQLVVSAADGGVLATYPLSYDMSPHTYRVYADSDPLLPFQNPYGDTSPHPTNVPGGPPPATFAAQTDFSITELSNTTDDPWLADGATETIGNNVDVFFNFTRGTDGSFDFFGDGYGPQYRVRGDAFDLDFRAPITSNELLFTYQPENYLTDYHQPFDSANNPTADQVKGINAKQVHAFYLANLMRDTFYDAGFTEAAGNAQTSNFGRGGIEGDPLIVHINSFTFVSTPEDGVSPVIHLGRSRGGDTSFDTSVFAHEWAHYMFRRLVNPDSPLMDKQGQALNEGWADLVGLFMTLKPAHVSNDTSKGFTSSYALGSYFTQDISNPAFLDPFFYGARRYPYGINNPFTFRHIAHKEPLPLNIPFSDYNFRSLENTQIHTAGEIWANTVWGCFHNILFGQIGADFTAKRDLLASYIVGGLSLTPPNPTYLEARNGLLSAIKASSSGDYLACRQSFASKGMGSGAVSPPKPSRTFTELVESFDNNSLHLTILDSKLSDNLATLDEDKVLDNSESGELILTVRNTGFELIDQAILTLDLPSSDYQRLGLGQATLNDVTPGQTLQVRLPLRLIHDRHFDLTEFPITIALSGMNPNWARNYSHSVQHRTHFDIATQTLIKPIREQFGIAMQDWRLARLEPPDYVDSQWQERVIDSNAVFEIQLTLDNGIGADRAWESPWMRRGAGLLTLKFRHAFELLAANAIVEVSQNGIDWQSFTAADGKYEGDSSGFPDLTSVQLIGDTIAQGAPFKVRFRTVGRAPLTWRLDDIEISGVIDQPFKEILLEDGKDTASACLPIIAANGNIAVVCL